MLHDPLQSSLYWKSKADEAVERRDEAVVAAVQSGIPVVKIARTLAMSRRGIYAILSRAGLPYSGRT